MKYAIYLTSEIAIDSNTNAYGYWSSVTHRTKIYTSKKRATRGLEACLDRCYAYVLNGKVVDIISLLRFRKGKYTPYGRPCRTSIFSVPLRCMKKGIDYHQLPFFISLHFTEKTFHWFVDSR